MRKSRAQKSVLEPQNNKIKCCVWKQSKVAISYESGFNAMKGKKSKT